MTVNVYSKVMDKCTGCGCCANVCHVGAIKLKPGKDGFLVPFTDETACVGCDKCVKSCPALNPVYDNSKAPSLYAFRGADKIRRVSSSGGLFTLAAEYVLKNKGAVCGAAFDEDFKLRHIIVENEKELDRLRGSKYVQSEIGDVYSRIREILEKGREVLFTGTPCQCAGLRNFLGKDYSGLFVIDLICHGTPSGSSFEKYLSQKFKDKEISSVSFRDKKLGWTCENIIVGFSDGSEYVGSSKTDPYAKAFFRNLDLRKCCEDCIFSQFPRQGDITAGDFWGISAIDKTQTDGKGTSIIYVNSEKGKKLFDKIAKKADVKQFPFESTVIKNRIRPKMTPNPNRERFFKFLRDDRNTFESSVNKALNFKYDIGLVSNFYAVNFGGSLTQYAFYNTLEDLGYNCLMIERPESAGGRATESNINRIYLEMPYPKYALSKQKKDKTDLRSFNNNCDMFVVGSDQLFQYNLYKTMGRFVTLDWVDGTKKKIAYAASYGHDFVWGDKPGLAEMSYFMKKFDAFSVREQSGVAISKETFGVDAEWVLDPVFLCDMKHYDRLIEKSDKKLPKKYIASYILDPTEEKGEILRTAEKQRKEKAIIFSEFNRIGEYTAPLGKLDVQELKVEERLKVMKNCDLFITDSFHGTCFAIIMNKPFISIINTKRGGSRFESLLKMFGLEDRLVTDVTDDSWKELITKPIDFEPVNRILDSERKRCIGWLSDALTKEKQPDYCSYDVLIKRISAQEKEIQKLKDMVTALVSAGGIELKYINDPVMYLEQLGREKDKYIVIATVKDTAGISVSNGVEDAMKSAGFKKSIKDKHWNSYIGILDGGEVVYENISEGELVHRVNVRGIDIVTASRHFKVGNVSKNFVNGKDYSVNRRGLNITVIDRNTAQVVDSVAFDMHPAEYACNRKHF